MSVTPLQGSMQPRLGPGMMRRSSAARGPQPPCTRRSRATDFDTDRVGVALSRWRAVEFPPQLISAYVRPLLPLSIPICWRGMQRTVPQRRMVTVPFVDIAKLVRPAHPLSLSCPVTER